MANCVWWIAGTIGLDSGLIIFIDNLESRKPVRHHREISTTPRNIARLESEDSDQRNLEESLIRININSLLPKAKMVTQSNPTEGIQKLSRKQRKQTSGATQSNPTEGIQKLSRKQRKQTSRATRSNPAGGIQKLSHNQRKRTSKAKRA